MLCPWTVQTGSWTSPPPGRLHDNPALRKRPVIDLLLELLDDDEGAPLIHPMPEQDQRSVDGTCHKLNAFLLSSTAKIR